MTRTQTETTSLLTPREVATLLSVSGSVLYQWRRKGKGPAFIKMRSLIRYYRSDVEWWLREMKEERRTA